MQENGSEDLYSNDESEGPYSKPKAPSQPAEAKIETQYLVVATYGPTSMPVREKMEAEYYTITNQPSKVPVVPTDEQVRAKIRQAAQHAIDNPTVANATLVSSVDALEKIVAIKQEEIYAQYMAQTERVIQQQEGKAEVPAGHAPAALPLSPFAEPDKPLPDFVKKDLEWMAKDGPTYPKYVRGLLSKTQPMVVIAKRELKNGVQTGPDQLLATIVCGTNGPVRVYREGERIGGDPVLLNGEPVMEMVEKNGERTLQPKLVPRREPLMSSGHYNMVTSWPIKRILMYQADNDLAQVIVDSATRALAGRHAKKYQDPLYPFQFPFAYEVNGEYYGITLKQTRPTGAAASGAIPLAYKAASFAEAQKRVAAGEEEPYNASPLYHDLESRKPDRKKTPKEKHGAKHKKRNREHKEEEGVVSGKKPREDKRLPDGGEGSGAFQGSRASPSSSSNWGPQKPSSVPSVGMAALMPFFNSGPSGSQSEWQNPYQPGLGLEKLSLQPGAGESDPTEEASPGAGEGQYYFGLQNSSSGSSS